MKSITSKKAARALPQLRADLNKYTRGVCELVVGSDRFVGAAVLATSAANRMGAGYVKAYTCDKAADVLRIVQPSVVALPQGTYGDDAHVFSDHHPRATVIGCGMEGADAEISQVIEVLDTTEGPVLVDGGGLAALCTTECVPVLRKRFTEGHPTVITPHGGEAVRLLRSMGESSDDPGTGIGRMTPQHVALTLARGLGAVCVLKGPDTFIASGDEESEADVLAMLQGTPALAKAGTGDVLAGAIGALLAQGVDPVDACSAGTYLHARAGMLASVEKGEFCVTAEDVLEQLPYAVAMLLRKVRKEGS